MSIQALMGMVILAFVGLVLITATFPIIDEFAGLSINAVGVGSVASTLIAMLGFLIIAIFLLLIVRPILFGDREPALQREPLPRRF